jgi:hypothetical protein
LCLIGKLTAFVQLQAIVRRDAIHLATRSRLEEQTMSKINLIVTLLLGLLLFAPICMAEVAAKGDNDRTTSLAPPESVACTAECEGEKEAEAYEGCMNECLEKWRQDPAGMAAAAKKSKGASISTGQ